MSWRTFDYGVSWDLLEETPLLISVKIEMQRVGRRNEEQQKENRVVEGT